jgi:sugar/nucleoside kinase (ribokinase family)
VRLKTVLVAGPVFLDIIPAGFAGLPENGTEAFIDSIEFSPGGVGITAAVLTLLGSPVELISAVGSDTAGQFVRDQLARYGVDTSAVSTGQAATPTSIVFSYNGDRSFITSGIAGLKHSPDIARRLVERIRLGSSVAHLHTAFEYLLDEEIRAAVIAAHNQGVRISASIGFAEAASWKDPWWDILRLLDIFFLNKEEAAMICKTTDPASALRRLRQHVSMPVMTLGQEGCMLFRPNTIIGDQDSLDHIVHIPSSPVEVVTTCGAGDSFAAAFIAAQAAGMSAEESAAFSVHVGAAAVASAWSVPHEDYLRLSRAKLEAFS